MNVYTFSDQSSRDDRLFVNVLLNNKVYKGLVDTGSVVSYVDGKVANDCRKNKCYYKELSNTRVRVANGQLSDIKGMYCVDASVRGARIEGELRVMPSLTVPMLIGLDWLVKLQAVINVCARKLIPVVEPMNIISRPSAKLTMHSRNS